MTDDHIKPFIKHIDCIKDPRRHNIRHMLHDMLLIALCAIISGADSWTHVAEYGRSKQQWFSAFLALPNGIPSHDTFGRVFAMLDPKDFQNFFRRWIKDFAGSISADTVCIDGKTLRGSHDKTNGQNAIHMVSAWAANVGMVLGQLKTEAKSNEIVAIPELIKSIALENAVVTIDAMGCQKKITRTIIDQKADYVIQVKENPKKLHDDIVLFFQQPHGANLDCAQTIDGDHGRIETREYVTTDDIGWLQGKHLWAGIKTIAMVTRERDINGTVSKQKSYFISSLESDATAIENAIRSHWTIENSLHWCLDISFREDHCRIRKDHAPENMAILRHMAINLLKQEKSFKGGIQAKRLKAAWDHCYLLKILST